MIEFLRVRVDKSSSTVPDQFTGEVMVLRETYENSPYLELAVKLLQKEEKTVFYHCGKSTYIYATVMNLSRDTAEFHVQKLLRRIEEKIGLIKDVNQIMEGLKHE